MEHQWRLGVLGLGEGRSILSAAKNSPMWQVAQICDLNENLCKERMAEFGLTRYTLSYEEMLQDETVDVIGIYTPDPLHSLHIRETCDLHETADGIACGSDGIVGSPETIGKRGYGRAEFSLFRGHDETTGRF